MSRCQTRARRGGFTLFEALVALAVFMLAFGGLAIALDAALGGGIEAREAGRLRRELESRLALCMADPPQPGNPRKIPAAENRGIEVAERMDVMEAKNAEGEALDGLYVLKIEVSSRGRRDSAETVLYRP
ncbi:MAG: prepilin-type N-terminal cleavage/methylation domain-containing protein [Terrimicrobiaceae bacterium]|nr:prepilin-type N-terminal cleavage/methylation domain-containing protein [Terrimicrobiaceae bacterium]